MLLIMLSVVGTYLSETVSVRFSARTGTCTALSPVVHCAEFPVDTTYCTALETDEHTVLYIPYSTVNRITVSVTGIWLSIPVQVRYHTQ